MITDEQKREFWEKCGFVFNSHRLSGEYYNSPLGEFMRLPPIDLNNLFLYAKNRVQEKLGYREFYKLLIRWCADIADGKDPTNSLLGLFYPVITGKEVKHDSRTNSV